MAEMSPAAAPSTLSVTALAVSVCEHPDYRPAALFDEGHELRRLACGVAQQTGVPLATLSLLSRDDRTPDVSALALTALGPERRGEPLFLVRSGPLPDPHGALLARLVHESGWLGEDVGITHLDELGGTLVFDLLAWAVPAEFGATALICDDPLFAVAAPASARVAAAAVQVSRGPGPLRVLGCGEGAPAAGDATHRFSGRRPCDGWIALRDAVADHRVADGERVLIHTRGTLREGWLLMEAADIAGLKLLSANAERESVIP